MIGKLLKDRYRIVQVLNAGAFGQIYVAEDTHQLDNSKCLVKHIKSPNSDRSYSNSIRRRFVTETEALKNLSRHQQIPRLYACFEENQEFYLVQEFISGHPLSAELPISRHCHKRWTENQVIQLLHEVLSVLEFVNSQGFIHCDLKPNNLIRRISDSKLFLIDFGSVQSILSTSPQSGWSVELENNSFIKHSTEGDRRSIIPIAQHSPKGYISPEQLRGKPSSNSDIYALGLIGIQALTGLDPAQLHRDAETSEVIWQHEILQAGVTNASLTHQLASILNQMVRYNSKDRYQSASEALEALQQMVESQRLGDANQAFLLSNSDGANASHLQKLEVEPNESALKKQVKFALYLLSLFVPDPSPIVTGMAIVIAANVIVISFGLYSLLHAFALEPEPNVLSTAQAEFQTGDLEKAIALAKSIPINNPSYPEAQNAIAQWRRDWNIAGEGFKAAERAFDEGRWSNVLEEAKRLQNIAYWQQKIEPFVQQAKLQIDEEAQKLLKKAYDRALLKDFTGALKYLKQIPPETSVDAKVEQKLVEYNQKQRIKADYLLQQAYDRADVKDFTGALHFIQQVPQDTSAYAKALARVAEYTEQQRLQQEAEINKNSTDETSTTTSSPQYKKLSWQESAVDNFLDLNPGSILQEVSLNPIFI